MVDQPLLLAAGPLELLTAGDGTKTPTFSMTCYSGGIMVVSGYGPVAIDLQGADVSGVVPILVDHDQALDSLAGQGTATIRDHSIHVAGKLTEATPAGAKVVALARSGITLQASVGFMPAKREFIQAGQKVAVNGRTLTAPDGGFSLVRSGRLREVSLLSVAADSNTHVSIAASAAKKGIRTMSTDRTPATQDADTFTAAWDRPGLTDPERVQARWTAEKWHDRSLPFERAQTAMLKAMAGQIAFSDFERVLLRERLADAEIHAMHAGMPKAPAIHGSRRDLAPEVLEAAFARTAGLGNVEKHYRPEVLEGSDRFKGLGLQELILRAAAANGWSGGRTRIAAGNFGEVLQYAMIRGSSTYSLPGILSNSANKLLLDGFTATEQAWRQIARIRPVGDFKTATRYRLTADAVYEELPPSGTIKHGTLGEESYTVQARTYAKMFSLDRTDIVNDDLGAFDDLKNRLGRGAGLKLNQVFWTAFMDNAAFFTSARGNYQEGAGTALTDAGTALTEAEQLFMDLTDADGNPLGFSPSIVLVPSALSAIAQRLYVSAEIRDTTASTKYPTANIFQNKYRPVVSSYLSKSTYTGHSAKAWYLLADPANLATVEVCFLDGIEAPTVESADTVFDQLGISFRGYHDFGVGLAEWRAGVKSKGEA